MIALRYQLTSNGNFLYSCQLLPKVAIGFNTMRETLITVEQVAGYLSVDKFTVYRLIAKKEIPAFKVGSQWRFKRSLIDAWLVRKSNFRRKNNHRSGFSG